MMPRLERLLLAMICALFAAGITLMIASAKDGNTATSAQFTTDCAACHQEAKVTWENGPHGKSDVMTCETCHGSASADHPKTPMTIRIESMQGVSTMCSGPCSLCCLRLPKETP